MFVYFEIWGRERERWGGRGRRAEIEREIEKISVLNLMNHKSKT